MIMPLHFHLYSTHFEWLLVIIIFHSIIAMGFFNCGLTTKTRTNLIFDALKPVNHRLCSTAATIAAICLKQTTNKTTYQPIALDIDDGPSPLMVHMGKFSQG